MYKTEQKFTINNPPNINEVGFIIEQDFLRHIKSEVIPNLEVYLSKLNIDDWTCLLAENPRHEFFKFLTKDLKSEIDWEYVISHQLDIQCEKLCSESAL